MIEPIGSEDSPPFPNRLRQLFSAIDRRGAFLRDESLEGRLARSGAAESEAQTGSLKVYAFDASRTKRTRPDSSLRSGKLVPRTVRSVPGCASARNPACSTFLPCFSNWTEAHGGARKGERETASSILGRP